MIESRRIDGPDPTLVFLHEGLGCVAMWKDFPDRVCAEVGLGGLVFSRRGYGKSEPIALPRPVDFMQREAFDFLPGFLEEQKIRRPILVGHSDGATIALLHASRFPVTKVVVMAPHLFVETLSIESIEKARVAYETTDLRARLARYHGDNVDIAFRGWNDVWLDPSFAQTFHIEADVANITAPVLVIQGRDDEYGTLAQVEAVQPRGPVERVVLERCGHSPHKDQPRQTLDAIVRFLR